mmetsp:Transcript_17887/g.17100  ORF Transcript_17887/g.17100 Transcript_17887/m.17100 type:complete len:178 (+) Transcript_17887:168-701(+)
MMNQGARAGFDKMLLNPFGRGNSLRKKSDEPASPNFKLKMMNNIQEDNGEEEEESPGKESILQFQIADFEECKSPKEPSKNVSMELDDNHKEKIQDIVKRSQAKRWSRMYDMSGNNSSNKLRGSLYVPIRRQVTKIRESTNLGLYSLLSQSWIEKLNEVENSSSGSSSSPDCDTLAE